MLKDTNINIKKEYLDLLISSIEFAKTKNKQVTNIEEDLSFYLKLDDLLTPNDINSKERIQIFKTNIRLEHYESDFLKIFLEILMCPLNLSEGLIVNYEDIIMLEESYVRHDYKTLYENNELRKKYFHFVFSVRAKYGVKIERNSIYDLERNVVEDDDKKFFDLACFLDATLFSTITGVFKHKDKLRLKKSLKYLSSEIKTEF